MDANFFEHEEKVIDFKSILRCVDRALVCFTHKFFCRYARQVIDETLRCSVLAPWGARIHEYDLQVGEFVIPKEVQLAF